MPWLFLLSCGKISRFGVLCSFEEKIFVHRHSRRVKKYLLYFKAEGAAVEKKIPSKPCKSLCEAAQSSGFSRSLSKNFKFQFIVLLDAEICRTFGATASFGCRGNGLPRPLWGLAMTAFRGCLRLFRCKTVPICHCEGAQRPWQSVSPNFALCILHFAFRASAR